MGYDTRCTIVIDGRAARGTACLEQKELLFRGTFRVAIPLVQMRDVRSDGGSLFFTFEGRPVELRIGPAAARWAERIVNPPSRLDKLGVKPGMRVCVVGRMEEGFEEEVRARGAMLVRRVPAPAAERADILFFGADRREDLDRLAGLIPALRQNGALWVIRPKGQPAVTERDTMAAGKRAGLVDVKVVSFSDRLTAEKFVIPLARRKTAAPAARPPRQRARGSAASRT
jgi:hypothetical protein